VATHPSNRRGIRRSSLRAIHHSLVIRPSSQELEAIRRKALMHPNSLPVDIRLSSQEVMGPRDQRLSVPVSLVHQVHRRRRVR
jgi:hypothetical protein